MPTWKENEVVWTTLQLQSTCTQCVTHAQWTQLCVEKEELTIGAIVCYTCCLWGRLALGSRAKSTRGTSSLPLWPRKKAQKMICRCRKQRSGMCTKIFLSQWQKWSRGEKHVSPHQLWAPISGEVQLHSCLSVHHDLPRPTSLIGFLVVEKLNIILNRISDRPKVSGHYTFFCKSKFFVFDHIIRYSYSDCP